MIDWLLRIYGAHGVADLALHRMWIDAGPNQPGRGQLARLQHRPVDLVVGRLVQSLQRISHDADDSEPGRAAAVDSFAYRILAGPVMARHRFVDDHDRMIRLAPVRERE